MTDRDIRILEYLTQVRVSTTEQIQEVFFKGLHHSIAYRRLSILVECKLVKRVRYRVSNKNIYIYYLDSKPSKRNLEHDLLITELYVRIRKCGFEILEFERSPIVAGIVPDAIARFRRPNIQEVKSIFLECQLSPHDCISKYYNIKSKVNIDIPGTLYIVTNQHMKDTELRDLKVVVDDLTFRKLEFYFS